MTMKCVQYFSLCLLFFIIPSTNQESVDDYLNKCLKSRNQKTEPSVEPNLVGECAPYKDNSCCTQKTSRDVQTNVTWLNLDWDHCPGKKMPEACRRHFVKDLCFYECSPNKGPWTIKVNTEYRQERFKDVPLCESDCLLWWEDCKTAYTCLPNWVEGGFEWSSGVNKCPDHATCRPFTEVFRTSVAFCENLYDASWKVVPDNKPCMKLSFTGPNPNAKIARDKAVELISGKPSLEGHVKMIYFAAVGVVLRMLL